MLFNSWIYPNNSNHIGCVPAAMNIISARHSGQYEYHIALNTETATETYYSYSPFKYRIIFNYVNDGRMTKDIKNRPQINLFSHVENNSTSMVGRWINKQISQNNNSSWTKNRKAKMNDGNWQMKRNREKVNWFEAIHDGSGKMKWKMSFDWNLFLSLQIRFIFQIKCVRIRFIALRPTNIYNGRWISLGKCETTKIWWRRKKNPNSQHNNNKVEKGFW